MKYPICKELAIAVQAYHNCISSGNKEWEDKWEMKIHHIVKSYMPSGSGIDNGTKIDLDASTGNKLVFTFGYHHMNDGGYYTHWTEHVATVTPSLTSDFDVEIIGDEIDEGLGDYLDEVFANALNEIKIIA